MIFVYKFLCETALPVEIIFVLFFNFSCASIKHIPFVVNRLAIIAYFSSRACIDIGVTILERMFRTILDKNEKNFFLVSKLLLDVLHRFNFSSQLKTHDEVMKSKAFFTPFLTFWLRQISLRGPCNHHLSKQDISTQ